MALNSGTKLGPYEIQSPLGVGGMGEVYLARDTRLDRTVAVKILSTRLSDNPDAKRRFEREARAISSLNHPNICTLYDIGHQDGVEFLVMEFLMGETLAIRLMRGPLPAEQVLKYAVEICEGLEKAHRTGVIHRDLKPGNIMLTKTGAKLMDFGLAKVRTAISEPSSASTVTLSRFSSDEALTAQGMVVGTFQYMSPELVEGKEADARSDIFAFGAVLYEMATGRRAFTGKSQASIVAAILSSEPPAISTIQPTSPRGLDRVVKACLAKEPDERFQSVHDLKLQLDWIAEGGSQAAVPPAAAMRGARQPWVVIMGIGTCLLCAAIASLVTWGLKPTPPQPVTRTVITLSPGEWLAGLETPVIALSPDGTRIAYVASRADGVRLLHLRAMDSMESTPVSGTEGATGPFFSPDGQGLGFFAGGSLKKVSVNGGVVLTLADAQAGGGASWGRQGMIAFAPTANGALQLVPETGGNSQPLTLLGKGENTHRWPEFLPNGKTLLFTSASTIYGTEGAQIGLQSIERGERRNLVQTGTQPRYASSGHLVYGADGRLMAVPFDPQRLVAIGAAVPVVEGVLQSLATGVTQYSISTGGSLLYVPGGTQSAQRRLVWVTRNGIEQPLAAPVRAYRTPRLSPDGRRVAVAVDETLSQVWLYDLARDTLSRFTFEGVSLNSAWTPDGRRIAFESNQEGPLNIFWQLADGRGGLEHLVTSKYNDYPMSWSRDGQLLAFIEIDPTTGFDIWVLRLVDHKPEPFLRTPFLEGAPRFSPDGRWLTYVTNESGRVEVCVQPYPGPGGKWQISTDGGTEPAWNPDGRELFYRNGDKMMAVDIATRPGFAAGKPHLLFEGRYVPSPATAPNYDVAPDGKRFLMLKTSEQQAAAPTQINVVLNWFEELKRQVPTGKK